MEVLPDGVGSRCGANLGEDTGDDDGEKAIDASEKSGGVASSVVMRCESSPQPQVSSPSRAAAAAVSRDCRVKPRTPQE